MGALLRFRVRIIFSRAASVMERRVARSVLLLESMVTEEGVWLVKGSGGTTDWWVGLRLDTQLSGHLFNTGDGRWWWREQLRWQSIGGIYTVAEGLVVVVCWFGRAALR